MKRSALLFALSMLLLACDRPPGECLAHELAKPAFSRTTWAKHCECDLRGDPGFLACVEAWQACQEVPRRLDVTTACNLTPEQGHDPNGTYLESNRPQTCCANDVVVGSVERWCDRIDEEAEEMLGKNCDAAITCDRDFDACLRAL